MAMYTTPHMATHQGANRHGPATMTTLGCEESTARERTNRGVTLDPTTAHHIMDIGQYCDGHRGIASNGVSDME